MKPKIFISSTFFDMQHIRSDIENFIKSLGYDVIMNERGHIPYDKKSSLENNCYAETKNCDILIGLIGSRFGSKSGETDFSISMQEMKNAIDNKKQVYICILKKVLTEYDTYKMNRDLPSVKYANVDDIRIFQYIDKLNEMMPNVPLVPFENANDIIVYLREQFAGLFQRFLQEESAITETSTIADLKELVETYKKVLEEQKQIIEDLKYKWGATYFDFNLVSKYISSKICNNKIYVSLYTKRQMIDFFEELGYELEENECLVFTKDIEKTRRIIRIDITLFNDDEKIKRIKDEEEVEQYFAISELPIIDDNQLPF